VGRVESLFQAKLIKELETIFPGCWVLKNDANYKQGVPDLIVLWKNKWAMLECKASATANRQPNQEHYISELGKMSFASFIHPGNKEQVLDALQRTFKPSRKSRVP
jgi:hypothetical protein